jgi:formylglycine-generating enzyme required for sulfatase activity
VEQASWLDCVETLQRLGLILPTEAQWERGARADSESVWWTGNEIPSLRDAANVADSYARSHRGGGWPYWEMDLDDGSTIHAEIGSYRANAFGLHDVIGNVWEWCREGYGNYRLRPREADGERHVTDTSMRVYRGGSFANVHSVGRSAYRNAGPPELRTDNLGLRPARAVQPSTSSLHAEGK